MVALFILEFCECDEQDFKQLNEAKNYVGSCIGLLIVR